MSNITTTDVDGRRVALGDNKFEVDQVYTAAGAETLPKGTILARNTSTLKWQKYVKGGSSNGNGVPQGVLTHELECAAAVDYPIAPLISGPVLKQALVIFADLDDSNIDGTVRDLLRDVGIILQDVTGLSLDDNVQQVDS